MQKRNGKLSKGVLFLQDNAHVCMAAAIQAISELRIQITRTLPYSPNLAVMPVEALLAAQTDFF